MNIYNQDKVNMKSENWQQQSLDSFLMATLREQRAKRRWGIFFKLLFASYFIALLIIFLPSDGAGITHTSSHTALIRIQDEISAQSLASADQIIPSLTAAFENPNAKAIILELNSPGGSPVQAGELYDEILRLRRQFPNKPVYSVITDVCASGCYYIAIAADEIYANEASLVGSIGVLYNGFGMVDLAQKVGVQRRLITAGKNKGFLDPFLPINPEQEALMHTMLDVVHKQFIDKVKARRSTKLAQNNDDLFSGLIWTGEQAIPLGLVDKLASPRTVAREVIGTAEIVDYTQQENFWTAISHKLGMSFDRSFKSLLSSQYTLE